MTMPAVPPNGAPATDVPPPEPFPGYGEFEQATSRSLRAATKGLQETEQRLLAHKGSKWMQRTSAQRLTFSGLQERLSEQDPWVPYGTLGTREEVNKLMWQREQDVLLAEHQEAIRLLGSASWFSDFYASIPSMVGAGLVTDLSDYLELMKSDPTDIVSQEDLEIARETITRLVSTRPSAPRDDAPDWLQIEPEEEAAVREFLKAEVPLKLPISIHQLTTAELVKTLSASRRVPLPEGMTDEEVLAIASVMDIPQSELDRAVDITELLKPYSDAIVEREERIRAVLAGEEEWEAPEMAFWQRAMFTFLSPMQTAADLIKPYIENVSYPIAGFVSAIFTSMLSSTQGIEDQYAKMKAMGYNWWDAMSEAWQEVDLPWYLKLPTEIITDPITWIPGLGLSIPGKILGKVPIAAVRSVGGGFISLNRGIWYVTDLPFDAFKAVWAGIPKTFKQATKLQLDTFRNILVTATTKQTGKIIKMVTPDDFAKTLQRAVTDFAATPNVKGDVFVDLGKELVKHTPLKPDDIAVWSKSLGGKLDDVTPAIVESVEEVISNTIARVGSPAENAKRMAIALGIDDTPATIGKIIKDISVLTSKYLARVPRAIKIGETAKIRPVLQMTEYLVSGQKAIISAVERSEYAKSKFLSGMILGMMNKVDKLERGALRMTIDRWLVRPTAEAYLGNPAYPIWNAFESIIVSALEGVVPRQAKQAAFQRSFLGVRGVDSRVAAWSASDVAGMLGTMPGREGSISLLPGKIPPKVLGLKTPKFISGKDWFEWSGRKWIELSDTWGTAYRANFLTRKMSSYLAEYSYNVAGHDINAAFKRLIGKPPKIAKETLGLTSHELKQEMFERLATGLKTEVLGMKELVSNSSLMQGEALKILRQATEISPQAKALGEQIIARGEALRTVDDVTNFCKTLADQSIADLRAFPTQAPESFRFMADQMERQVIDNPEDLMQLFQHFEVMADSASHVPMKLLSQVFEEADELKRLGQFQKLETLWRTSRAEVEGITSSVNLSVNRARAVIQANSKLLKDKEQIALNSLMERNTARVELQQQFLKFDGRLLDDFWALPKAMRTESAHSELRAYRRDNILSYKGDDAVLGAGDFLERQSYAKLYNDLPAPRLFHVDATSRSLSADDCAKAMHCNVDALTTGLMENMAFQDKPYFIQMIKQSADANPNYFKGFTEAKIGQVYDDIITGLKMSPEADIASQKILQQVEGVNQRMQSLRMTKSLSPNEEKALHGWVDDTADGMAEVFGREEPVIPTVDLGLGESIVEGKVHRDVRARMVIEDKLNVLADEAKVNGETLKRAIARWTDNPENETLQLIGRAASVDEQYLTSMRVILREQYPSGYIRVFRGKGAAKEKALDREFTNITSSKRIARDFGDSWTGVDVPPDISDVLIKVDDVVSIGSVPESELIIPSDVLRSRITNPLPPPTEARGGLVTTAQWEDIRQKASESAHKEYYKAFADYTNENILDAAGKMVYPFWTYHMYRWFFLSRTFLRKPGTAAAWGKYNEYSDKGYMHIPGTDLEFSPAVGSAFGATFSLTRHDFKSYYENLGFLGEVIDYTQKRGWFPGIHFMLPVVLSPIFSGRPPELGEVLPPVHRIGLNLLVASKIPVVADAARWLKDRVFHENFHDYYTSTIVSTKQVDAGGKLIGGQSGVDLWFKQQRGETLTDEEQSLWDEAYNEAAWIGILRSEFPEFRLKPAEMIEAHQQVTALIEAQTGMDAEYQDNLWKHNKRPTDEIGGLPLDLRMALDQMWQWRIYFGRASTLMPPEYSDLYNLMDKYYDKVENLQLERLGTQVDTDAGFLRPTAELHFSGREWRAQNASSWANYSHGTETLEKDPEFADAVDAMTPEGQAKLMTELGFTVPSVDPMKEAIGIYFDIELQKKTDPYTGEEDWDYLRFWLEREAVRLALPEEQRADFDAYVRRYKTPMEIVFKNATNKYLRGYRAVTRIVLEEFPEEEQALLAEYYADTTTRERKLEIKDFTSHSGRKLISYWDSRRTAARGALREASPNLDFWLYVFGYITVPKTEEAKAMVDAWEKDKSSITRGITESPMLELALERAEERKAEETK